MKYYFWILKNVDIFKKIIYLPFIIILNIKEKNIPVKPLYFVICLESKIIITA